MDRSAVGSHAARDPATASYRRVVPSGEYWLHPLARGETWRMVDVGGNQAADTLFFNAADPGERYSAVDTIRAQAATISCSPWRSTRNMGSASATSPTTSISS